jgi:hypothetical protein
LQERLGELVREVQAAASAGGEEYELVMSLHPSGALS